MGYNRNVAVGPAGTAHREALLATLTCVLLLVAAVSSQGQVTMPAAAATSSADRDAAWHRHLDLERTSEFRGLPWRPIGPAFQGGRIEAVAVHPSRPDTWYVGAGAGSVWKTTNAGTTWSPIFEDQPTFAIGDIAIAPSNPDIVWVGTGEVLLARSSYSGAGVFRSTDGGASWRAAGLKETRHIAKVAIDPRNANVVHVAALGRSYGTNAERGVFRTSDGGKTWQKTLFVNDRTGAADIVFHPRDPRLMFAVMWEHDRRAWNHVSAGSGSGLYRSMDSGQTWTRVTAGLPSGSGLGRMAVRFAPSRPDIVYLLVSNESPAPDSSRRSAPARPVADQSAEVLLAMAPEAFDELLRSNGLPRRYSSDAVRRRLSSGDITPRDLGEWLELVSAPAAVSRVGGELYRSEDGGRSWRRMNDGPIGTAIGYDFCEIEVAPDNPDEVYVLGNWLRRSRDGGRTYETVGGTIVHLRPHGARVLHLDHHELAIDPGNPDRLILGNDGGVYTSRDRGATWLHVNNLPIAEFYAISVDDRRPYRVYGGTQDDGALFGTTEPFRQDANEDWEHVYLDPWGGGDSYFTLADVLDPDVVYFEHQFGDLRRKNMRTGATAAIQPQAEIGEPPLRYNWMTPFLISNFNPLTLYYGANRVMKSVNRGDNWTAISPDLTTQPGPERRGNVPFGTITTMSESPVRPGILLVGTDDGRVQYTRDDGRRWIDVSTGLPGKWVSRVVASARGEDTFYVSMTGYREGDSSSYLFRSADRGRTWTSISANLPAESVNVLREDPRNTDVLYVGTDLGVYVSLDVGASWISLGATLPTAAVHDLVVHPREDEIVIGTHGLSAFVLDARPIQQMTAQVRASDVYVFEPRAVRLPRHPADNEPVPQDRRAEAPIAFYLRAPGPVTITVREAATGSVQRTLRATGARGVNVAQWDLRVETMREGERAAAMRDAVPGTYTVTVQAGVQRATAQLEVVPFER